LSIKLQKLAGIVGILGPLFFGASIVVLTLAQYDFMRSLGWDPLHAPTFDWPSGLSLGPYGWLMTATFILSGAFMLLFAFGLRTTLHNHNGKLGATLFMLAGLSMMGLAFTTDPTIRSTPATWHGRLHDLSFVLLGLTLAASMVLLGLAFRQDKRWKNLSSYTWITVALALPAFALKGIAFYFFLAAIFLWSEIIAIRLIKTAA
jgi:hypothetical protein